MNEQDKHLENVERLLRHLAEESLATRLVQVHGRHGTDGARSAMEDVLDERLRKVREALNAGED